MNTIKKSHNTLFGILFVAVLLFMPIKSANAGSAGSFNFGWNPFFGGGASCELGGTIYGCPSGGATPIAGACGDTSTHPPNELANGQIMSYTEPWCASGFRGQTVAFTWGPWHWFCMGANGGPDSGVCIYNPPPVNGVCGNTTSASGIYTCNQGTLCTRAAFECGVYHWYCCGSSGGSASNVCIYTPSSCSNGANNPPCCTTFNPCSNGATNPPYCTTFNPCSNGATNPPTCSTCPGGKTMVNGSCVNNCTNGATNPPACNNGSCPNGATNPPACTTFPPCSNGATNPPACTTFPPCTNGATNPPACNNGSCPNGANNPPSCTTFPPCTNGATNPPACNNAIYESGSGSGSGSGGGVTTVTFTANPSTIYAGDSSTLTWSSPVACEATGGFSTGGASSGSVVVSPTTTSTYQINCGGTLANVTVTVRAAELSITANPMRVQAGKNSVITWSAANVSSCTVSGPSGNIASGNANSSHNFSKNSPYNATIITQSTFTITCKSIGNPDTSEFVTVNVIPFFQEF